jgi:hypothetical protein
MATEVAKRLARYGFASQAKAAPSVVRVEPLVAVPEGEGDGWDSLVGHQRELVKKAPATMARRMVAPDGGPLVDDPASPLVVVGSCFVHDFRDELIAETNLLPRSNWNHGQTTEAFGDFLSQPELLGGVRVVVWVIAEFQLPQGKPLPSPILAALEDAPGPAR